MNKLYLKLFPTAKRIKNKLFMENIYPSYQEALDKIIQEKYKILYTFNDASGIKKVNKEGFLLLLFDNIEHPANAKPVLAGTPVTPEFVVRSHALRTTFGQFFV